MGDEVVGVIDESLASLARSGIYQSPEIELTRLCLHHLS
jgi:hypothetical protein